MNIQDWFTLGLTGLISFANSFSSLEPVHCSMSSSNCCFLTCIQISQEVAQVIWYSHLLKNFPQSVVIKTSLMAQMVKYLPIMWETKVWSVGQEYPLEKEMATHSSIPAWRIPWMEEPGGLQSTGSQRVRHDWVISLSFSFTRYQSNAKNSPIQVSTVPELWMSRCSSCV